MAGVTGLYYGLEEASLLQMREDVLVQLASIRKGKRFTSVSGGGKAFAKDNARLNELHTELREINAALQRIDPTTYGQRVRRIFSDFSNTPSGG